MIPPGIPKPIHPHRRTQLSEVKLGSFLVYFLIILAVFSGYNYEKSCMNPTKLLPHAGLKDGRKCIIKI